ncbi:hypothetical protein [Streptomyces sp. 135]|nr:hypothetical protein [Streptomyces sp. 135]
MPTSAPNTGISGSVTTTISAEVQSVHASQATTVTGTTAVAVIVGR